MFEFLKNLFEGNNFIQEENEALIDLLLLAMYSDFHLAKEEEETLDEELLFMDWKSVHSQEDYVSASVIRARDAVEDPVLTLAYLRVIAARMTEPDFRKKAKESLYAVLKADHQIDAEEEKFISLFKQVFG